MTATTYATGITPCKAAVVLPLRPKTARTGAPSRGGGASV